MLKKLWADEKKRDTLLFAAMTVLFTLALYAGGASRGFISTFPIFFITAVAVFLFYRKLKNSLLMTVLLSLTVSLADSTGYNSVAQNNPTMNYAFIKVLFFVLTAALAYFVAGLILQKTKSGIVKTVIAVIVYLLCFNAVCGNIFGAVKWHNETAKYLEENYPLQKIESMSTAFNFKTHYYETAITFKEPKRSYYGEETMVLENNYDGYFLYAKNAMFEIGAGLMMQAVRDSGSTISFAADNLPFEEKLDRKLFDLGGDYALVLPKLSYEVVIKDDTPDIKTFEAKCSEIVSALDGNFYCTRIVFYGGEKGGFLFQGEARDGQLTVQEFDKAQYTDNHRLGALS
ncbi:MAG: ECF transporter S component [Ruminococcaceae bacterium]|nr:ECF transporter S component [Oscillospiraceae bacterium]